MGSLKTFSKLSDQIVRSASGFRYPVTGSALEGKLHRVSQIDLMPHRYENRFAVFPGPDYGAYRLIFTVQQEGRGFLPVARFPIIPYQFAFGASYRGPVQKKTHVRCEAQTPRMSYSMSVKKN